MDGKNKINEKKLIKGGKITSPVKEIKYNKSITPIGRKGGKSKIANQLIELFPNKYKTYVEPFFGAGNIFFRIPNNKKAKINIINDLDKDVYSVMFGLQNDSKYINDNIPRHQIDKNYFNDIKNKFDPISSIIKFKNSYLTNKKTFRNEDRLIKTDFRHFEDKLKDVIILNESFEKVIKKYDDYDTFIYLDPPYESKKKNDYDHYVTPTEVYDAIKNIKGKFMISYNDSENIRNIFKNYNIKNISTFYEKRNGRNKINELIITNY